MGDFVINKKVVKTNTSGNKTHIGGSIAISLVMRTLLFALSGASIVGLFVLMGNESPLQAAEKWWPFQAILANILTFLILRGLLSKEGIAYFSLFSYKKGNIKKNVIEILWLLLVGLAAGAIPLYLFSYLLLDSVIPPDTMFQELPVWAAVIALILFPITNGLVETPTYIGYALPRIKGKTGKLWPAILLAGTFLALQHIALPLVFDVPYMLWRFLSFVPLAMVLGFIFTKTNRLLPIAIAHGLMDLQLVVQLLIMTF
ncbi:CPBP family glutamic-type intramembrane protease [Neobacillus dielmonensis]|uniref:CPBP family glutamic-type intramembrane protease n=1 Tax=Neobacillus dielmonensis TaxID=1347369 RepID=UPI0005AA9707|nr:CPBP family intramembrane glutamic endopeptidase [Neobacillus dielmonensis]